MSLARRPAHQDIRATKVCWPRGQHYPPRVECKWVFIVADEFGPQQVSNASRVGLFGREIFREDSEALRVRVDREYRSRPSARRANGPMRTQRKATTPAKEIHSTHASALGNRTVRFCARHPAAQPTDMPEDFGFVTDDPVTCIKGRKDLSRPAQIRGKRANKRTIREPVIDHDDPRTNSRVIRNPCLENGVMNRTYQIISIFGSQEFKRQSGMPPPNLFGHFTNSRNRNGLPFRMFIGVLKPY